MFSRLRVYWKGELEIQYRELILRYATRSSIAKRWFYPRYISGHRVHEPPISHLIYSELDSDSVFFDVWANVGFFTVLAAKICTGSEGEVHAFELDPTLIPLIEKPVRLNENRGLVHLNCAACTDQSVRFHSFGAVQENNPFTNRIVVDKEARGSVIRTQAMTTRIDQYWEHTGPSPDLIKMDIERAEALAVSGMMQLIESLASKLILEVHPERVREFGTEPIPIVRKIQKAGERFSVPREPLRGDSSGVVRGQGSDGSHAVWSRSELSCFTRIPINERPEPCKAESLRHVATDIWNLSSDLYSSYTPPCLRSPTPDTTFRSCGEGAWFFSRNRCIPRVSQSY